MLQIMYLKPAVNRIMFKSPNTNKPNCGTLWLKQNPV